MEDNVIKFLEGNTLERLRVVAEADSSSEIFSYMGEDTFKAYRRIAERTLPRMRDHLGVDSPPNLIFVPGVMGSLLFSRKKGGVWWVDVRTRNFLDKLKLNEDGSGDADSNNGIEPFTTDITYEPLFAAILERDDFGHVIFPFDWRKSLLHSATALRDKLLETHNKNGNQPVHFVGHSMGGLMIRAMLTKHGDEIQDKIGRIAFIGTPHYGSPAIASYLKNHLWGWDFRALLGRYISRETFRTLRGVINMLPAPLGIYPGTRNGENEHPCSNFDMYDADAWKLELNKSETEHLKSVLDEAANFHRQLYENHDNLDQRFRDRMAVIAGVGYKTLFRLEYDTVFLGLWEHTDKITTRVSGNIHREGDSTVPLASATLENVGEIRYVKGEHGNLPMIPAVYNDVFRWLNDEGMQLPLQPAGALRDHLGVDDLEVTEATAVMPPLPLDAKGDVDFWDAPLTLGEEKQKERVDRLQEDLKAGRLGDFIKVKIL